MTIGCLCHSVKLLIVGIIKNYFTIQLQLRDKNERLHLKLDQVQGNFSTLATTKTDLSAQLLMTEEEKLKVFKLLT